ncbi:MAG: LLM class F420-dependent oxidoreductase [Pseudomonadales bacterium]
MTAIGVHFPQAEIGTDYGVIKDYIQSCEALGFDHINVPDHVIQTRTPRAAFPAAAMYTTDFPHHETFAILAYAAGITSTIRLKTAVLILPQRQTVLVAKQAAEIDLLSGGRLDLGVGIGWNDPEYTMLNMAFSNRGKRFEEQIEVCRLLWSEQHANFKGQWHQIEDAGLAPMPLQRPIPVWIGAFAPAAIARAARIGNGWQSMLQEPTDAARTTFADFRKMVEANSRDPRDVGIEATIWSDAIDPDSWLATGKAWLECGATQLMFRPRGDFAMIKNAVNQFAPLIAELRNVNG